MDNSEFGFIINPQKEFRGMYPVGEYLGQRIYGAEKPSRLPLLEVSYWSWENILGWSTDPCGATTPAPVPFSPGDIGELLASILRIKTSEILTRELAYAQNAVFAERIFHDYQRVLAALQSK